MQPYISDRPGVLKDEQFFTPWRSLDMEGANPADILSVCHSTNTIQAVTTTNQRYHTKEESFRNLE